MNVQEIKDYLRVASNLRMPRLDPNDNPGLRIKALEEYLYAVTHARGDLAQSIGWVLEAKHESQRQLDGAKGWEKAIPKSAERTEPRILAAKAEIFPDAYVVLVDTKHLLDLLERQQKRLDKDYDALSRAYTLITGAA